MGESLDRFCWLINTILKPQVFQMVLHRPIECTAVTGKVGTESNLSNNPDWSMCPVQRSPDFRQLSWKRLRLFILPFSDWSWRRQNTVSRAVFRCASGVRPLHMSTLTEPGKSALFLPLIFSGTASG